MTTITITTAAELETLKQFIARRLDETRSLMDKARSMGNSANAFERLLSKVLGIKTTNIRCDVEVEISLNELWDESFAYDAVLDEIKAYEETGLDISESPLTLCFESLDGLTRGGQ